MAEQEELFCLAIENNDMVLQHLLLLSEESKSTYCCNTRKFNIEDETDQQALNKFRFDKENIRRLAQSLALPEQIRLPNRCRCSGTDALCILLRRLVYPNRLSDLETLFGRPKSTLSLIVNYTLDFIYDRHGYLLSMLDQPWFQQEALETYATAIHAKGAPLTTCFGFIDGTVRPICRPTKYQRVCYNGHKRVHGLKFQSVVLPNGLIGHLFAPLEGRRHDCALLRHSGLLDQLEERQWRTADGHCFALYGDPAYPNRDFLISPFRGAVLTAEESAFNRAMSSVRECVEWEFGKILSIFAYLDYKKNQKIFLQPVAKYYIVGAILANCHTCLYGNQTSNYFDLRPPTLEEYLHSL